MPRLSALPRDGKLGFIALSGMGKHLAPRIYEGGGAKAPGGVKTDINSNSPSHFVRILAQNDSPLLKAGAKIAPQSGAVAPEVRHISKHNRTTN